jgi:hypothetical protein
MRAMKGSRLRGINVPCGEHRRGGLFKRV